jgi:GNAT superfamily N-acetyltransferase
VPVQVRPATPDRWPDVVTVFGRRGEDPSWCWCRRFVAGPPGPSGPSAESEPELNHRDALHDEIHHAAVAPGLLAYVDDRAVGWSRVGPRSALPGVRGNRALARVLTDDPGAWWVACFAVDNRHRHSGIGSALLEAAVSFARDHGATALEGHPVDVGALRAAQVGGSAIFTGTMAMFSAAGFTEVARTYPTRPVMRRLL